MTRIVVYAHRPKRPPPKQASTSPELHSAPGTKSAIVKPTNEKLLNRLRAEWAMQPSSEPNPEVEALFARNVRPGGPLPPHKR